MSVKAGGLGTTADIWAIQFCSWAEGSGSLPHVWFKSPIRDFCPFWVKPAPVRTVRFNRLPVHPNSPTGHCTTTTSGLSSSASSFTALSAPANISNSPIHYQVQTRQATVGKARSSHQFCNPAGSSSSASGAPQQVSTPPGPPNRTGPTASIGSNSLASNNNKPRGRLLLEQLMAG
jgi:hypothetical protein